MGKIDFDLARKFSSKHRLTQATSIIDPENTYVCLGHRRPWDAGSEQDLPPKELHLVWNRKTRNPGASLPAGEHIPTGSCTFWFEFYMYNSVKRKQRWQFEDVATITFDEHTPPENLWQPPVWPRSFFFPAAMVPFGPNLSELFPVPGQVYRVLNAMFGGSWNATCGGWQRGTTACSTYYQKVPFVFTTHFANGSELMALKVGKIVMRTFLFEPPVPFIRLPGNDHIAFLPDAGA